MARAAILAVAVLLVAMASNASGAPEKVYY